MSEKMKNVLPDPEELKLPVLAKDVETENMVQYSLQLYV